MASPRLDNLTKLTGQSEFPINVYNVIHVWFSCLNLTSSPSWHVVSIRLGFQLMEFLCISIDLNTCICFRVSVHIHIVISINLHLICLRNSKFTTGMKTFFILVLKRFRIPRFCMFYAALSLWWNSKEAFRLHLVQLWRLQSHNSIRLHLKVKKAEVALIEKSYSSTFQGRFTCPF